MGTAEIALPDGQGKNIIYSFGNPYGAPMFWLRGGGLKLAHKYLSKKYGIWWSQSQAYAMEGVRDVMGSAGDEKKQYSMEEIFDELRTHNYVVKEKDKKIA